VRPLGRPNSGCSIRKQFFFFCKTETEYTGSPTRYRTRHFFNNFTTNEDIATNYEADLTHCVRNVKEKNVLLFKFRCNIFIGVRIIKEMPGLVASGILCINTTCGQNTKFSGASAEFRKASIRFVMSVSLPVRLSIHGERLCSHWTDFCETLYLSIFENL
jgi:hypothetical protein